MPWRVRSWFLSRSIGLTATIWRCVWAFLRSSNHRASYHSRGRADRKADRTPHVIGFPTAGSVTGVHEGPHVWRCLNPVGLVKRHERRNSSTMVSSNSSEVPGNHAWWNGLRSLKTKRDSGSGASLRRGRRRATRWGNRSRRWLVRGRRGLVSRRLPVFGDRVRTFGIARCFPIWAVCLGVISSSTPIIIVPPASTALAPISAAAAAAAAAFPIPTTPLRASPRIGAAPGLSLNVILLRLFPGMIFPDRLTEAFGLKRIVRCRRGVSHPQTRRIRLGFSGLC